MISKYRIMGCPIVESPDIDELETLIAQRIDEEQGFYSVAINAEKISFYNSDPLMKNLIDGSWLPYADGSGALLGLKMLYKVRTHKINMPVWILEICARKGFPLFMLGARENVIARAVDKIREDYPSLNLAGYHHGFFEDEEQMINIVKESGAKIVMVAMGSPRQELLAGHMLASMPGCVFIGCGGAFDILAGEVVRAPVWIQNAHLEWLYRLFQNPKRIKRQIVLPVFAMKLLKVRLLEGWRRNNALN